MVQIVTIEDFQDFTKRVFEKLDRIEHKQQGGSDERWLKSGDVKTMLNISHGKLQTMRNNKEISYTKVGGVIFYDRNEINRILTKGMQSK
ncbi:helix-turn-helix domain-containing protein [Dysgonomonas sp. HDW5B]|uniref:helix-turn-helix domain-containing protein n=1 Tax=Dysgonomonas sp. HDW5B TaxID=2714927 RepID=UPI00140E66BA|nr:helix-turn-helix domain-containing protein [Dysgonomonas sp. HDW5B]QIK52922.1 helix-turn-helix domain-containing protein [Dysgonomonas sp. HDW5B]